MSSCVEFMESECKRKALMGALQYLLVSEAIEGESAKGITRQVIAEGSIRKLTTKQTYRYEQDVLPLLEVDCDGHCGKKIVVEDIENAYLSEMECGGIFCQHCAFDIENQNSFGA